MPAPKPRLPGRFSHELDEFLEEFLLYHFDRIPVSEWNDSGELWISLKWADPATAKRIIAHALQICADRGEILPDRLAAAAISYLVRSRSRNRIQDREKLIKAATFQARYPKASLRQIAQAAGVDHTVVREWKKQFIYKMELVRQLTVHAEKAYKKYLNRFGSPFSAAGLPEPPAFGLTRLRSLIAKALYQGVPITDVAALRAALRGTTDFASVDRKTV
jgi:hypothetical protein